MLTRRRTFALLGATALAGCANILTPSQLQSDLTTLDNGLGALWNALSATGAKLPANLLAQAQTAITAIQANAQAIIDAIQAGNAVSSVASVFQALLSGVNALVPIIATFYPPATAIGAAVSAAVVLVQIILSEAGITTTPSVPAQRFASQIPMSADEARTRLKNAAQNGL